MMSLPSAGPLWEVGMAKTMRLLSDSKDEPAYRWPSMGGLEARNRDRNVFDEEELVRGGVGGVPAKKRPLNLDAIPKPSPCWMATRVGACIRPHPTQELPLQ